MSPAALHLPDVSPVNHREGESWAWCVDCAKPYVIEDCVELVSTWNQQPTRRFVCRWHAARRREKRSA